MAHALHCPSHDSWPWVASHHVATPPLPTGLQLLNDSLHWPFDTLRNQHAQAVRAGLIANSILASRDFEHAVDALEHVTLGPFARSV